MIRPTYVNDAINIDEVGIQTGWYGRFQLKSAYQPVFLHRSGVLHPFAVEGLIRPFVEGRPVAASELFEAVPPEDRLTIETLCRALHLRNHHNIGVPGLELFFNFNPHIHDDIDKAIELLAIMARRLVEIDLDIRLLVCEITEAAALDRDTFIRLAAEMRRIGMRLAIDDFGSGHSTLERVDMIEPDIVKIDGSWFRRVVDAPGASRLLANLIAGFQRGGAGVLVEGIETPDQLTVALESGADYVQGYLLGRPKLAGTIFDTAPKLVEQFRRRTNNVVQLFARASA